MKKILAELDQMAPKGRHGKGPEFEKYLKRILEIAPEFQSQFRKVWLWDDYPDRRGGDLGIDLVAEDKQGERVAIQAKCYAPDGSLSWPDLSTFYGDAMGRAEIKKLMLFITTDNLSPKAKKKLRESQKPCAIWDRSLLKTLGIPDRTSLSDLEEAFCPPVEKHKPRRHQKTAIKKTLDHLEQHRRGQLLMACGTGKTLVGLWIREQMEARKAKRTIVFVPSIALLRQTWASWNQHCSKEFYSVSVCSDERATSRGGDALVSSPSAVGLPPTTDPDVIAKALDVRGPIVVFSTYQSSEVVEEAIKKSGRSFDLMIADEAHNTTSAGLTAFTRPLYNEHIPTKRRIFLTATPRIVSKQSRKRGEEEGYDIHSMDDTEVYGEVAYRLRFSEAIKKKLLTDYEIFVVGVDDTDIADAIREREFLKIDNSEINGEELAAHIAIHRAMKKRGTRRMITFHSRINQAETFSRNVPLVKEWLRKNRRLHAPKVWGNAVSGKMDVRKREKVLERFDTMGNDEHGIVSNARCLGEGVDVPTIDGISFVQPKRSPIDIVQAVGRAIRKSKKKKGKSTIILPVPILDTSDPTDTIESSAFETVWRVLESLRAHDDELEETLDTLRTKLGGRRFGKVRLPKLTLDLPRSVNAAFNDAIQLQVLRHSTESFWEGLGYLKSYEAEHGHCRVPGDFVTEGGFKLGSWVSVRRRDYKKEQLAQDRIDALNELGFVWDPLEEDFQEGLSHLKAYKTEHGHSTVPAGFKTEDGFKLGMWLSIRRGDYRDKLERLTQERIDALDALDFIWDPFEYLFQEGLGHLKAYKTEHGDCLVPARFTTEDGFALGGWVTDRRKNYKIGRLTQDRIDALDALDFIWDPLEDKFKQGLGYLKSYEAEHGHCRVHYKFKTEDEFPLGGWVTDRRKDYKVGRLTQDRIDALNALGFIWDPLEEEFQEALSSLAAYKADHGHCRVHRDFITEGGFKLGGWVGHKRRDYKVGRLTQDRIDALNELGFAWEPFEEDFQVGLGYLKSYEAEHGHCRVPGDFVTEGGFKLGEWVGVRRGDYRHKRERLTQDRIDALNALGFIWDPLEEDYQRGLGYLKAYKAEHGDYRVPARFKTEDGFRLGVWCNNRRSDYKNGRLSQERIDALNALDFIWDARKT